MRTLSTSLIVVCLLMSSLVSPAGAQAIPPHVKEAITKLVGEWTCETEIDGKPVHLESLRFFTFTGDGEWHGRDTNRMLGGKPQPDSVSICKRKK